MARFGTLAFLCFVLSVLVGSLLSEDVPSAGSDPALGEFGQRLEYEVRTLAEARFREAPGARERFAALYPTLHHRVTAEQVLADLAADPELAPLTEGIRAVLEHDDPEAHAPREGWDDPGVQRALVRALTEALHAAQTSVPPDAGGA